jgi:aminoglycoside phosphotransferase (APT) family kinase protein
MMPLPDGLAPAVAAWINHDVPFGARLLAAGWDCDAVAVGGVVVKRPRNAAAGARLRREVRLLALIGPRVRVAVPQMQLVEGPPVWSWHPELVGQQVLPEDYDALAAPARNRLAGDLARLMADLHAIPVNEARAVGAVEVQDWVLPNAVWPPDLCDVAERLARTALPPDPLGQVLGQFDGHGWNMAFDPAPQVLTGVYDFGDAGIGPLHRDFIYAGLTSLDLMERVVVAYQAERGVRLDMDRIAILAGQHRLWEMGISGAAEQVAQMRLWRVWWGG